MKLRTMTILFALLIKSVSGQINSDTTFNKTAAEPIKPAAVSDTGYKTRLLPSMIIPAILIGYGLTTIVLDFRTGVIPSDVGLLNQRYRVSEYYEKPLQCYRCYEYGHYAAQCRGDIRCLRCGEPCHLVKDCGSEQWCCIQCKGAYKLGYWACPA